MAEVILTATNPEDSSVVPVACNEKGELLLDQSVSGIPGPPGPEGPQGPPGSGGGGITLPPNPENGDVLGWYNDELAWLQVEGVSPGPRPTDLFGPILEVDSSTFTIQGYAPRDFPPGSILRVSDIDGGTPLGINNDEYWRDHVEGMYSQAHINSVFDGSKSNSCYIEIGGNQLTFDDTFPTAQNGISIYWYYTDRSRIKVETSAGEYQLNTTGYSGHGEFEIPLVGKLQKIYGVANTENSGLGYIKIDDKMLVDSDYEFKIRIQTQVDNHTYVGFYMPGDPFKPSNYLKWEPQTREEILEAINSRKPQQT